MGSYFGGAPLHNDIGANQLSLLTWQQQCWADASTAISDGPMRGAIS